MPTNVVQMLRIMGQLTSYIRMLGGDDSNNDLHTDFLWRPISSGLQQPMTPPPRRHQHHHHHATLGAAKVAKMSSRRTKHVSLQRKTHWITLGCSTPLMALPIAHHGRLRCIVR